MTAQEAFVALGTLASASPLLGFRNIELYGFKGLSSGFFARKCNFGESFKSERFRYIGVWVWGFGLRKCEDN